LVCDDGSDEVGDGCDNAGLHAANLEPQLKKATRLTVAPEQQPCGVQVVERVDLVGLNYSGFFRFNF
jgi:hypothetical protein